MLENGVKKPLIAVTFSGIFVNDYAFKKSHEIGMKELAKLSGVEGIIESINSPDYFTKVEKALAMVYPTLSSEERIKKRKIYFERVVELINANNINQDIISSFRDLKKRYRIGLITSISSDALDTILSKINLNNFFDIIETPDEPDNKEIVWRRFLDKYGKPEFYIGESERDREVCWREKIPVIELRDLDNL